MLYMEQTDFINFPVGGTSRFASKFIMHNDFDYKLVGLASKKSDVGRWSKKIINSKTVLFFGLCTKKEMMSSLLPKRVYLFYKLFQYKSEVFKQQYDICFTRTPQFLFISWFEQIKELTFVFAGLENSVGISKYKYLQTFSSIYHWLLIRTLNTKVKHIGAAADKSSIQRFILDNELQANVTFFPTLVDSNEFYYESSDYLQRSLNLSASARCIVVVGKLIETKGWKLAVQAFEQSLHLDKNLYLIFIGDGPSRESITKHISKNKLLSEHVLFTGNIAPDKLRLAYCSSSLLLCCSQYEGWSNVMNEALACGLPIVSTPVSGASQLIRCGQNGAVISSLGCDDFAHNILLYSNQNMPNPSSLKMSEKYKTDNFSHYYGKLINDEL